MLKVLKNHQLAEDATQKAFLCHWRFRDAWRKDCSVNSWLYAIARNCALEAIRERKRPRNQMILEALNLEDFQSVIDLTGDWNQTHDRIIRKLDAKQKLKLAHQIIETLPRQSVELFKLVRIAELTVVEACRVLDIPLLAGKSRLQRAGKEFTRKWRNHFRPHARQEMAEKRK